MQTVMRILKFYLFMVLMVSDLPGVCQIYDLDLKPVNCSHRNSGMNHGRISMAQAGPDLFISGHVYNAGNMPQDEVMITVIVTDGQNGTVVEDTHSLGYVAEGDTVEFSWSIPWPSVPEGVYASTISVAGSEGTDITPANNSRTVHFAIDNSMLSLDGIGVTPNAPVGMIGSSSFLLLEEELQMLAGYDLILPQVVYGIEVLLGPGTQEGSKYTFLIVDIDLEGPWINDYLYESSLFSISATEISNGHLRHWLSSPITLPAGQFYLGILVLDYTTQGHLRIRDDVTRTQSNTASMVYADQQLYSNGNALAIRMLVEPVDDVGIEQTISPATISVHPVPAGDRLWIRSTSPIMELQILDQRGRTILEQGMVRSAAGSSFIDISSHAPGIYFMRVLTDQGITVTKFIKE